MDLERRTIEKRDFTAARKGYDTDEVDRHLRAIAEAVEALKAEPKQATVAGVAAERVEAIVAAAEASARQIEESARADAQLARERAQADAAAHVERAEDVADQLTARAAELHQQISEVVAQIGVLQAGVASLAGDLGAPVPVAAPLPELAFEPVAEPAADPEPEPEPVALQAVPDPEPESASLAPEGARLVALNMALSGTPREETARYLRENYDLANQEQLLDDVYAKAGG
jgi:DivIVA domain-containing protein